MNKETRLAKTTLKAILRTYALMDLYIKTNNAKGLAKASSMIESWLERLSKLRVESNDEEAALISALSLDLLTHGEIVTSNIKARQELSDIVFYDKKLTSYNKEGKKKKISQNTSKHLKI